jgi:hypothetical protein
MPDAIGRLRIVCVADRARAPAALAVRRRLEEVARFHLPAALERQVEPGLAVSLGRLNVRLDFDPLDYDDETLATLWASRIRTAILAAGAAASATAQAAEPGRGAAPARAASPAGPPAQAGLLAIARRVLAGDDSAAIELAHAVTVDPGGSGAALTAGLTLPERRALISRLATAATAREARRRARGSPSGTSRRTARAPAGEAAPIVARTTGRSWAAALRRVSERLRAADAARGTGGRHRPATWLPRGPAHPAPVARPDPRAALRSTVAGLGLLWPWLGDRLEASTARQPTLDPIDLRRVALAALVPDQSDAVDDPLVRILAGDDLSSEPSTIVLTAAELAAAVEGASEVLDAFAAAIPGFAGTSAAFVRREFVVRPGEIEHVAGDVVVRLAALPLDPALALLPYPLGPFRLPWTPSISLRLGAQ